jgi:hypothetical protein
VCALDDPARALTETSCTGHPRLRAVSVALTFAAVTAVWLPLVWTSGRIAAPTPPLRIPGLYIELLALSATGWMVGAAMASSPTVRFVPARAAGLLAMIVAITLTTPRTMHWFWVGPGTEWNRSHARWACVAVVALAMFAWASRDPARTRIGFRVNRTIRSPRLRDEEQTGSSMRRQP